MADASDFTVAEQEQVDEIVLTAGGLDSEEREVYLAEVKAPSAVVDEARRRLHSADDMTDSFLSIPASVLLDVQQARASAEGSEDDETGPVPAGGPPAAPKPTLPGFGDVWDIQDCVGRGGMARVYKAIDRRLGRPVALKVLTHENPMMMRRFLREARAQAQVRHANILEVYDIGELDAQPYIAMRFVDGESLMAHRVTTSVEQKARLIQQVAEALHAAHSKGLLHRDVKPSNVLVEETADGLKAWVSDFGIVTDLGGDAALTAGVTAGITAAGTLVGTPAYVAPERLWEDGPPVDRRADVYSLGVTMYQFFTGRLPFGDDDDLLAMLERIAKEPPLSPRELEPSVPAAIEAIILKCLAKDPEERYPTARALAEDLERYLKGERVGAQTGRLLHRMARHRKLLVASAVVLALAVAGLWGRDAFRQSPGESPQLLSAGAAPAGGAPLATPAAAEALTTVILVRHAEKVPGVDDPGLTPEGEARARELAHVLGGLRPDVILSTDYARTLATAAPLAEALGQEVVKMQVASVEDYVEDVVARIHVTYAGKIVVVVGHSNTTPDVIRALGIEMPPTIADNDYDNLYVVSLAENVQPRLLALRFGRETE